GVARPHGGGIESLERGTDHRRLLRSHRIASYLYSGGEPFWLLFVAQGAVVIGSTFVLRRPSPTGGVA
ncbi:MAG TPA: hypothetical protein VGP93_15160, partial [Polyangiaceae bacterium]|nr:hypothetical protein [Polyangiaceae bacterium]